MRRLLGVLFVYTSALSQDLTDASASRLTLRPKAPELKFSEPFDWSVPPNTARSRFLKNLRIESFGFTRSPTGKGFEFPQRLTEGGFTAHGLECSRCLIRPSMDRSRYTLPPFGAEATRSFWRDRTRFSSGFGGVNAWKPDNTLIELGDRGTPFRRTTSFNDAWLLQGWAGGRFAMDSNRRFWLGGIGRYLLNFGEGKKNWKTVGANATFLFGR